MKQDRFGKAGVLSPEQIHLLFSEGLIQPRDPLTVIKSGFVVKFL